ncbi:MAG TPA: hypothetical protein DCQ98_14525 [Planctomycetaceae bacterium]|nr:hypothetical protein [Planctomycetaceae bacterium]
MSVPDVRPLPVTVNGSNRGTSYRCHCRCSLTIHFGETRYDPVSSDGRFESPFRRPETAHRPTHRAEQTGQDAAPGACAWKRTCVAGLPNSNAS